MKVLTKELKGGKVVVSSPSVSNIVLHGIGPKSEHIVKWNHSIGNQISESDMIRISRRVLRNTDKSRKLEKFIPRVLYTKRLDGQAMRFREMLGLEYEEKRILRFIIIEKLDPLYSIDDLGEFKSAVIDIFLGIHHLAISKERIKHRDITMNNLMFRRISGGKVQGVLSDWDSACNKETEGECNKDEMYVGTRAFISRELHIKNPLIHYERYDLESLLYSLYWISILYSEGKSRLETEISSAYIEWKEWNSYKDAEIYKSKQSFLFSNWNEGRVSPFFLPLSRSWLRPMRKSFHIGYSAKTLHEDAECISLGNEGEGEEFTCYLSQTVFNDETLGGHVTFEKIYKILLQ